MPDTLVSLANENKETHDLISMVERYVPLGTIEWNSATPTLPRHYVYDDFVNQKSYAIAKYDFPQDLFTRSNLIAEKVNNFMLMVTGLEIDLKTNVDPFTQGSLMVVYYPRSEGTGFRYRANEFLASVTSAPHRFLNVEESDSLRFSVPYANDLDYFNLTNSDNQIGSIYIYQTTPLRNATDNPSAEIFVRARFRGVELDVPTDNSLGDTQKMLELQLLKIQAKLAAFEAQSEGESTQPVSQLSQAVSGVAKEAGVPLIDNLAKVVGWSARTASEAAAFGFSKPTDLVQPSAVVQKPGAYMCNTEGKDASVTLAMIPDNAIDSSNMVPETVDELSLDYIYSKPNMVGRFSVKQDDFIEENLLFGWDVGPITDLNVQPNQRTLSLGSFGFTSALFQQWRGTLQYNLRIIKTKFHRARIMAVYFPNRTRQELPAKYSETMTNNDNVIFDFEAKAGEENSQDRPIIIPYSQEVPYTRTLSVDTGVIDASTARVLNGSVGIYCVVKLTRTETVSDTVDFILSMRGAVVNGKMSYETQIPQLQIRGGYDSRDESAQIITDAFNAVYNSSTTFDATLNPIPADTFPETLYRDAAQTETYCTNSETDCTWLLMYNTSIDLADGSYSVNLPIVQFGDRLTPATNYNLAEGVSVSVEVSGGLITQFTSSPGLEFLLQFPDVGYSIIETPSKDIEFVAQAAGETHDPLITETTVAHTTVNDLTRGAVGERCQSLRQLLKRFIHVGLFQASESASYTAFFLENEEVSGNALRAYRTRSSDGAEATNALPESWVSIISYLFRFYAGGFRTKAFGTFSSTMATFLRTTNDLRLESGLSEIDPSYRQIGVVNPVLETTVPFYSTSRARLCGVNVARDYSAMQCLISNDTLDLYEAGADDTNFFFMIGPPPVTPVNVSYMPIRTIRASGTNKDTVNDTNVFAP